MAKKRIKQAQPAAPKTEDQTAPANTSLSGLDAVRYSVAQITGLRVETIPKDEGLGWFGRLQEHLIGQGWTATQEKANVNVKARHVGLFTSNGELNAAVFEGDSLVNNPTDKNISANRLTQRIRVTKITPAQEDDSAEDNEE